MEDQIQLPPAPSLGDSITDVFTSPSDVFNKLKGTASKPQLWSVPLVATIVAMILLIIVGFVNESLRFQRMDAARILFEQRVIEGKMTQDMADQTLDRIEKGGAIVLVFQSIGLAIMVSILFFLYTLLLWLSNKLILKSTMGYGKHLEMYGIVSWIGVLGILASILFMLALNSIYAQPNLAIFIYQNYDITNSMHKILSLVNFFGIWQSALIGIALWKWSGKSLALCMCISFVIWIITLAITYLLGFGA